MHSTSLVFAFTAGLVSFAAPCVLPLIPGFLSYLAGTTLAQSSHHRRELFLNSLCFVAGFSVVFSALGILLNTVLQAVSYDVQAWLSRLGGAFIIFFGLYLTGLIKIAWLASEHKFTVSRKFNSRYLTSAIFGAAFAAGWTPCVGAVLGSILALAATEPGSALVLLISYSVGLGLPFLIVGFFAAPAAKFIQRSGQAFRLLNILFGTVLILLGVLIFTENLSLVANIGLLNRLLLR